MDLIEKMRAGSQQALARLITLVEQEDPETPQIMKEIYPYLGKAYTVGITGPPGAGKSTLTSRLTAVLREKGYSVGIIAADPTSPFSGGAVLGDRIRMQEHFLDEKVFIRSMATRGSHGGLPSTTPGVVKLMDAFGMDYIIVETVGVGQTELEIMETADTTVLVLVPEAGDTIQTMKAGIFEIADIFVVNKADRPGADAMVTELIGMLHISPHKEWWDTPVVATQAVNNIGIDKLYEGIQGHRCAIQDTSRLVKRRKEQRRKEFIQTVEERTKRGLWQLIESDERLTPYLEKVEAGVLDPYSAAMDLLSNGDILKDWTARTLMVRR
jgi:LAO/AO transport system kinase